MMPGSIGLWLGLWLGIASIVGWATWRAGNGSVGLVFAYLVNLSLIHWLGAAAYLSDVPHLHEEGVVTRGVQESVWAVAAFAVGSLVMTPLVGKLRTDLPARFEIRPALLKIYLLTGALCYWSVTLFLRDAPTLTALAAAGQQLFIVGVCLYAYRALIQRRGLRVATWIGVACLIPIVTLIADGFVSYGTAATIAVLTFVGSFTRPRLKAVLVGVVIVYVGLSALVTYMQHRTEIRVVVDSGPRIDRRVQKVLDVAKQVELFSPSNQAHLDVLDDRMNQSYLIGATVERTRITGEYAYGRTLVESVIAIVPRAIWPEKPIYAGSGDLVTRYSGIPFGPNTSVGIGHVLEFYVNFGTLGVIAGFVMLGMLVTIVDQSAFKALRSGDWQRFTLLFLCGLSLVQTGGSLVETTAAAGASVVLAMLVNNVLLYRLQRETSIDPSPNPLPGPA